MLTNRQVQQRWQDEFEAGVIGICDLVELELLYSARSLVDRRDKKDAFGQLFSWVTTPDAVWSRSHRVQQLLTERGEHRSAGAADLLIAATAELNRLVVLHYDRGFDAIAAATGQPAAWVAEPGSIS